MSLEKQMKSGLVYCEYGHSSAQDRAYEQVIEFQRNHCKELTFDFNHTRPGDTRTKRRILEELLGSVGEEVWMESPVNFAYGCNTYIGHHFYANFNMSIVDDGGVHIGNYVMFGPNVTVTVTGHPVWGEYRRKCAQFSLPVVIEDDVWIGANTVVLPGVTIGKGTVIGAGSVVTHDIPAGVVAFGAPCRVIREISGRDRLYYRKDLELNPDWDR